MEEIKLNSNVYNEIVKVAKSNPDQSINKIEEALALDGKIDNGEKAVLEALKSNSKFTITNGSESKIIEPYKFVGPVKFPYENKVSDVEVGKVYVNHYNIDNNLVNLSDTVPEQVKGKHSDTRTEGSFKTPAEAHNGFIIVSSKLLDINDLRKTADSNSIPGLKEIVNSDYKLMDTNGKPVTPPRSPKVGGLIRIDVPGPGPDNGGGYDWVKIDAIDKKGNTNTPTESLSLRLRPCPAPGSPSGSSPAHFYTADQTTTFVIERKGATLSAGVHSRNEVINAEGSDKSDILRNYATVAARAVFLDSDPHAKQWKNLTGGLLTGVEGFKF